MNNNGSNMCNLYNQRNATYTMFFIIISARPSSGAYKTVCAALGIVMLSCCLPLVWMCWSNPSTPAVDKVPDDGRKNRPNHVER
jgi:hypothetical protein